MKKTRIIDDGRRAKVKLCGVGRSRSGFRNTEQKWAAAPEVAIPSVKVGTSSVRRGGGKGFSSAGLVRDRESDRKIIDDDE